MWSGGSASLAWAASIVASVSTVADGHGRRRLLLKLPCHRQSYRVARGNVNATRCWQLLSALCAFPGFTDFSVLMKAACLLLTSSVACGPALEPVCIALSATSFYLRIVSFMPLTPFAVFGQQKTYSSYCLHASISQLTVHLGRLLI